MSKKQEPEQETNKDIVSDKKTITNPAKKEDVDNPHRVNYELKPEPVLDEPIEITDKADPLVDDSLKEPNDVKDDADNTEVEKEFNWDDLTNNEIYSDKERQELSNAYSATLPVVESKQVIDGTVVYVSDREVIVDINFKSDGVISSSEFKYNDDLKAGDTVEVLVEKQEDKNGQLILSHRRARVLRAWEKVNVALETGEVVNGQIKSRTKGGMIVDVFGIECFLARFSN